MWLLYGWRTGKTCGAKLSVYGILTRSALWFVGQMSIAGKTISAKPLIILCIKLKKRAPSRLLNQFLINVCYACPVNKNGYGYFAFTCLIYGGYSDYELRVNLLCLEPLTVVVILVELLSFTLIIPISTCIGGS